MKSIIDKWIYVCSSFGTAPDFSFITLTLSSSMKSDIRYDKLLSSLIAKLIYRYGKFNYCWKAEYQGNGNLHYHLMIDRLIDWKIVRRQWNLLQSVHVDDYQMKMKCRFRRGYFFDDSLLDYSGNVVSEDVQLRRYKSGVKANWRNPNSTDVKICSDLSAVGSYISKYMSKSDSEVDVERLLKRYWSCNDELRLLRYAVISESVFTADEYCLLLDSKISEVRDSLYRLKCVVSEKLYFDKIREVESGHLLRCRDLISYSSTANGKLIDKELIFYDRLFA